MFNKLISSLFLLTGVIVAIKMVLEKENIEELWREIWEILLKGHENDLNCGNSISEQKMILKSEM